MNAAPDGFPEIPFDAQNDFDSLKWSLGKKLFFDVRLSKDHQVSCASCHLPSAFFATQERTSAGAFSRQGTRNAPSLFNVAYHPYFLREGSVPTLEMQILVPIQEENEFAHNIVDIVEELQNDQTYSEMAQAAFNRPFDAYVLTRAVALFERTLVSGNSAYDLWLRGNENSMSQTALEGKALFFSEKTNCYRCHDGFLFSNFSFQNNGVYNNYPDVGRFRFSSDSADIGKFKVPSLRNVAFTPPYMFDGSLLSLEAVVAHYNQGGKGHFNQSEWIKPLHLNQKEQKALVAFLQSLTDLAASQDKRFYPEN